LMSLAAKSRAPRKNTGERQDVVDLVGKSDRPVATTAAPGCQGFVRHDFGTGLAPGETIGSFAMVRHHVTGLDAGRRDHDEDIGAGGAHRPACLLKIAVGHGGQFGLYSGSGWRALRSWRRCGRRV
jgi:hypothetical protein